MELKNEYNRLIKRLSDWREADHEDAIKLTRHEVIVLLEGSKITRTETTTIRMVV